MAKETKNCGCKGIRRCLLCEEDNEISSKIPKDKQTDHIYTYCPYCDLCWPNNEGDNSELDLPLYLGNIKVVLDFINEEEESDAIDEIDKIEWVASQSGRRKQDFGPKVNFKKKKIKVDNFKGFPKFTEKVLAKFKTVSQLNNFRAVELCNLEYTPERGSSIDPHVDDFWLWGERLVTVNLASSTVLMLEPFSDGTCECCKEINLSLTKLSKKNLCSHHLNDRFSDKFVLTSALIGEKNTKSSGKNRDSLDSSISDQTEMLNHKDSNYGMNKITKSMFKNDINDSCKLNFSNQSSSISNESENYEVNNLVNKNTSYKEIPNYNKHLIENLSSPLKSMCNIFRLSKISSAVAVRVELPPKSLLVLSGCARYNWNHGIRREDVTSRRLAMTFRELTPEFLEGGDESSAGDELLSIASNFCDFSV